jgi:hypothetical protein
MENRRKALMKERYEGRKLWACNLINEVANSEHSSRIGVEVGLWKADFAQIMLMEDKLLNWIGVDPYSLYGKRHRKQKDWDAIHERVLNKMSTFGKRFRLIRSTPYEAVESLPNNIDFIFIDGNHNYDYVLNDITILERKVKPGGIMAGHDYSTPKEGVRRAVNEYAEKFNRDLHIDNSFDSCGVFWWKVI